MSQRDNWGHDFGSDVKYKTFIIHISTYNDTIQRDIEFHYRCLIEIYSRTSYE